MGRSAAALSASPPSRSGSGPGPRLPSSGQGIYVDDRRASVHQRARHLDLSERFARTAGGARRQAGGGAAFRGHLRIAARGGQAPGGTFRERNPAWSPPARRAPSRRPRRPAWPAPIRRRSGSLPDTTGMKDEVSYVRRAQRVRQRGPADRRQAGGGARRSRSVEAALGPNTAMIYTTSSATSCEQTIAIAKKANVPLLLDDAAGIPPIENLSPLRQDGSRPVLLQRRQRPVLARSAPDCCSDARI